MLDVPCALVKNVAFMVYITISCAANLFWEFLEEWGAETFEIDVNTEVCVIHHIGLKELRLYMDFGRCSHPPLNVEGHKLLIKKAHIRALTILPALYLNLSTLSCLSPIQLILHVIVTTMRQTWDRLLMRVGARAIH